MLNRLSILFRAIWGYMIKFKIDLLGIGGVHKLQNRNEDKGLLYPLQVMVGELKALYIIH